MKRSRPRTNSPIAIRRLQKVTEENCPDLFAIKGEFFVSTAGPLSSGFQQGAWRKFIIELSTLDRLRVPSFVEVYAFDHLKHLSNFATYCEDGTVGTQMLYAKALLYLLALRRLAEAGSDNASRQIAKLSIISTKTIDQMVRDRPGAFVNVAKHEFSWPVLRSPSKKFWGKDPDWRKLKLGGAFPFRLSKHSRFNALDDAGQIAWRLWHHVDALRTFARKRTKHGKLAIPPVDYPTPSQNCFMKALALKDFVDDSWVVDAWFKVAWQCLLESYPSPHHAGELDEKHGDLKGLAKKGTRKARIGTIENRLSDKFYGFAGLDPRNPATPKKRD